jgi:hypothetical protein
MSMGRRALLFALAAWSALVLWTPPMARAQSASHRPNRVHDPDVPEGLTVVLRPEGFAQKEYKMPHGFYVLGVFNRSGIDDFTLQLELMPGASADGTAAERVASGRTFLLTPLWLKLVRLNPGVYRIRVAERPTWVCAIQVQ